ncbi:hypothetical protein SAMN06264855_1359 [Halorubrum vacuolatum]|uniref:DUF5305 domain-containing protein n=2 Tax=Halorubrum vacuolatum TaxID=63740 RepID=A0A238YBJ6_HALVU|nr:hypothetical protein SAMN06264855_1359 [Halorubrum vacuolatum]
MSEPQTYKLMAPTLRIKYVLSVYGGVLAVALLLLGTVAIGAGVNTYLNPPVEETPSEEFDVQTFSLETTHSAEVQAGSELRDPGETLEEQPVYLMNETPELQLQTAIELPEDRSVEVVQRSTMQYEIIFDGEVFWEDERLLTAEDSTVEDGELTINTTVSMTDVRDELGRIDAASGGIGSVSVELVIAVEYDSPAEGDETYSGELNTAAPVEFIDEGYYISEELTDSETQSQTRPGETREQAPDMTLVGLLTGSGLVFLILGGVVGFWSRRAEVEALELDVMREQYSEWISKGEFPVDAHSEYIYISSIKDLVDIAIDTRNRVIYDESIEAYGVVTDEVVFYHAADRDSVRAWLGSL